MAAAGQSASSGILIYAQGYEGCRQRIEFNLNQLHSAIQLVMRQEQPALTEATWQQHKPTITLFQVTGEADKLMPEHSWVRPDQMRPYFPPYGGKVVEAVERGMITEAFAVAGSPFLTASVAQAVDAQLLQLTPVPTDQSVRLRACFLPNHQMWAQPLVQFYEWTLTTPGAPKRAGGTGTDTQMLYVFRRKIELRGFFFCDGPGFSIVNHILGQENVNIEYILSKTGREVVIRVQGYPGDHVPLYDRLHIEITSYDQQAISLASEHVHDMLKAKLGELVSWAIDLKKQVPADLTFVEYRYLRRLVLPQGVGRPLLSPADPNDRQDYWSFVQEYVPQDRPWMQLVPR